MNQLRKVVISQLLIFSLLIVGLEIVSTPPSLAVSKNPYGSSAIDPAAPNEVILTLTNKKVVKTFRFADLLKMKSSTISIYEPFVKRRERFTVIPLKALFNQVSILPSQQVETRALNDYLFSATAKSFIDSSGYLAIRRDGVAIPYDQGGPIRIIFPDRSKWSGYLDAWNWSLLSISTK